MLKKTLLAFLALLFLQGCIGSVGTLVKDSAIQYLSHTSIFNPSTKYSIKPVNISDVNYTCSAFYCINSTKAGWLFTDTSLIGGNCSLGKFDPNNEKSVENFVEQIAENDSVWLRSLGIGFGPTFRDFNDALPFCSNSLNYAIQFLEGEGDSYSIAPIERFRSVCALEANVIPVYALYSTDRDATGRAMPKENMGDISGQLAGVGPVMLISETAPLKDEQAYLKVRQQIAVLKGACQQCMVFLGITQDEIYGEELNLVKAAGLSVPYSNERFYLKKLQEDQILRNLVDGVAFGIDSRFSKECGGLEMFTKEVVPLINYINLNLSLPTFIYYVYLPDTPNCKYTDEDYVEIYDAFFNSAPGLASSGLIGFAPQPFYEETAPFECKGCAFTEKRNGIRVEVQDRFGEFFSRCDAYYKDNVPPSAVFGFDGVICQAAPLLGSDYRIEPPTPTTLALYNLSSPPPRFFKCASCLAVSEPDTQIQELASRSSIPSNACDASSEVYGKADAFGVDGVVARATATTSSNNDKCFVAYSKRSGFTFDKVRDAYQEAGCGLLEPRYGEDCSSPTPTRSGEPACRISAMGLFGFSYGPGSSYTSLPTAVDKCGGTEFNPFREDEAICVFAEEFKKALSDANAELTRLTVRGTYDRNLMLGILTAGEIKSNLGRYVDVFLDIREANRDCNRMGSEARSLCCKLERGGEKRARLVYNDRYGVCEKRTFGEFFTKLADIPSYSDLKPAADNMEAYAKLYTECNDCYDSGWTDNICDQARKFGVFIRGCP